MMMMMMMIFEGNAIIRNFGQYSETFVKSLRSHYGPGVDSASNRNEYQQYFLGANAGGA
jgi:hypothetical protein